MNEGRKDKKVGKIKNLLGGLIERIDKKMEQKAKSIKCCDSGDRAKGTSCCS